MKCRSLLSDRDRELSLSPHGESGLKYLRDHRLRQCNESLPAWGEWIEIRRRLLSSLWRLRLSPHGESGLKFSAGAMESSLSGSPPAWGEWIEITKDGLNIPTKLVSPRMGRVD